MKLPSSDNQRDQICGYQIYNQCHIPEQAKGHIVMIHGLGEHSGRYDAVSDFFIQNGFAVSRFDLPGHGKSSGVRGDVTRYEHFYTIINHFIDKLTHLPSIIFSHSMGGNIAFNYLLQLHDRKIACASIGSPWIKLAFQPSVLKVLLSKLVRNIAPKLLQKTNLETSFISRIPEEVIRYNNDKLIHNYISPRLFTLVQTRGLRLKRKLSELETPVFLYHGKSDKVTSFSASQELSECNENIKFRAFDKAYHEVHNEPEGRELLNELLNFYTSHIE